MSEQQQQSTSKPQSSAGTDSRGGRGRGGGRGGGRGRGRGRSNHNGRGSQNSKQQSTDNTSSTEVKDLNEDMSNLSTDEQHPRKQESSRKMNNNSKNRSKNKLSSAAAKGETTGSANENNSKKDFKKGNKKKDKADTKQTSDEKNSKKDNKLKDNVKNQKNSKQQGGKKKHVNEDSKDSKNKNRSKSDKKNKSNDSAALLKPSIPPSQPQTTNDSNYCRGEKITVMHVAEKPSIAQAIVKGLAGTASISTSGKTLPVHEFTTSDFPKAPHCSKCVHRITSVAGHVFSVDFPQQYQSWDSVDPLELFGAPVVKKPNKGSVIKHLQDSAKGVNFIVLWMDCDREGENINFEVLDCCMHLMKSGGPGAGSNYDRVYRAHFSAINPSDIKKAYGALGKPDKNQSLSVDARQELDLKVGVAFSRYQTRYFQGRYGDLDSAVLSYGPCQTPTMGFCVQRHIDIETFKPEPFWSLDLGILKRGRMLRTTWKSGRSFNRKKTEALVDKCKDLSPPCIVKVVSVVTKEKKQGRPTPMNTVALLKACSKALGIGPHQAMQAAERLYLNGYLSYPRTESSAYPKSFDIKGTLQSQANDSRWSTYIGNLLRDGHNQNRKGVDMGDHPPITPCRSAAGQLSGDMARIYELVVRHFIASVSHDAVWKSTRVEFNIEALEEHGHFSISGKEIVSKGFLEVLLHKEYGDEKGDDDDDDDEEEKAIPEFTKGEEIPLYQTSTDSSSSSKVAVTSSAPCWASLGVKEGRTTPPSHLTESELIGLMEKNGIGTDASISTHIENILKRNYVQLESGRRLHPSKLGLVLCQGYHAIDSSLVLPRVRSDIEDQCTRISKGLASREDVVKRALEIFSDKFSFFVKHIDKMDVLFGSSFAKLEDVGKPFTRCGLTRRYLQYITGPPPRLYNKYTETVYPLPAGGVIKQWTGRQCSAPDCNFELCLYSVGQPERTFPLCPYCFNNPKPEWGSVPGDDDAVSDPKAKVDANDEAKERQIRRVGGKTLILECPLADKHPLIEEMTISPDPDSDGVLILDPHFGPKWRLVSTRDPTIVYLPKCISKITILDSKDDVMDCHLMQIEFKDGESPLEDGKIKYVSCFASDELLSGMSRVFHGSERTKASSGRGGRGRGRGRGGRGRGRSAGRGRSRR